MPRFVPTVNPLPRHLCNFLDYAFQKILYCRRIYPAPMFYHQEAYGCPTQCFVDSRTRFYIWHCLAHAEAFLSMGKLEKIRLVLHTRYETVEFYEFDIIKMSDSLTLSWNTALGDLFHRFLLKIATTVPTHNLYPMVPTFEIHLKVPENLIPANFNLFQGVIMAQECDLVHGDHSDEVQIGLWYTMGYLHPPHQLN